LYTNCILVVRQPDDCPNSDRNMLGAFVGSLYNYWN